jgi:Coat F domain.
MDKSKEPIQPNETVFNDFDKADDILNCLKKLLETYNTFSIEAGSKQLHEKICGLKHELSTTQRQLFDVLYAKGWYPITAEDKTKLSQMHTKFSNMANQLTNRM